jgi:hypothetical protein
MMNPVARFGYRSSTRFLGARIRMKLKFSYYGTPMKPGSCTLPFFGVVPFVLDESGRPTPPGSIFICPRSGSAVYLRAKIVAPFRKNRELSMGNNYF